LAKIVWAKVDEDGVVEPKEIMKLVSPKTVLVTVGMVNGEIGTVQDISGIGRVIQEYKNENNSKFPLLHTDACQAPNYLLLDRDHMKTDLISLDSGKIYGPKGVGVLFVKSGTSIESEMFGGGQEKGLRPGTEAVPLIMGFAEALEEACEMRVEESLRLRKLQQYFFEIIAKRIPQSIVNGSLKSRVPNNVSICIPGINSEFITIALGEKGVLCSPGSACNNVDEYPTSEVMKALGKPECAPSSLRFSMGRGTKKPDIDRVVQVLSELL